VKKIKEVEKERKKYEDIPPNFANTMKIQIK
jgi:hypothetical protein